MIKFLARGINHIWGTLLQKKKIFVGSSLDYLHRTRDIDKNYLDYVRLSTLELICYEINSRKLDGNVAELGVYKGKFARYINRYFPDKTLYLFDTFMGFDERDTEKEVEKKFSGGNQDFSDTSIDLVLNQMLYKDKCIPVKGFFPDSAKGIEDKFSFVSLDADLYEPIYNGLCFFYPRLVKGGYIMVHDFNNDGYKGARSAVEQFCSEQGIGYVPIPDSGGTAVICK